MLARRLTTILPDLTLPEALDTTRIHSVAGLTGRQAACVPTRPFRAPHHTISDVGLIGGGDTCLCGAKSRRPTLTCACWMDARSAHGTSSESSDCCWRRTYYQNTLLPIFTLAGVMAPVARARAVTGSSHSR
jgi:hypothetical protein